MEKHENSTSVNNFVYIVKPLDNQYEYTIYKDFESAKLRYLELIKIKIESEIYKCKFGQTDHIKIIDILTEQDVRALACDIVGDGDDLNIWFVTESSYIKEIDEYGDYQIKTLPEHEDGSVTTHGPFLTYQEACETYELIYLDSDYGVGSVNIEDRQTGLVKEKFLFQQTKLVTEFIEREHKFID